MMPLAVRYRVARIMDKRRRYEITIWAGLKDEAGTRYRFMNWGWEAV